MNWNQVVLCITCRDRALHIKQTLPKNLADNPSAKFVLINYNSPDDLIPYLKLNHQKDIDEERLVVYSYYDSKIFHMAHAKNLASRFGIVEGADLLVTLDADNFTGPNFDDYICDRFSCGSTMGPEKGVYLFANITKSNRASHARGVAGRLVIRPQEFIKAGGYDEKYDTWRGEDMDMEARLRRMGFEGRPIDLLHLNAIRHTTYIRFKEYPHAQQYENEGELTRIRQATHTVVNYGKFGLGTLFRNFNNEPLTLRPLPTRIFGVGLHKTATTSLHEAFKILGYDSFHWESNKKAWNIWNEMNLWGRSKTLEQYYAFCDLPIPMLYKELDEAYPGSKFILTVRSELSWAVSVSRLWDPRYNPWWDWDKQPYTNQIHQALYGRTDFDYETFLRRYRQHNAEIVNYFKDRPNDLLVMDMERGDGWVRLCSFLDRPVPNLPYPTEFKTKEIKS